MQVGRAVAVDRDVDAGAILCRSDQSFLQLVADLVLKQDEGFQQHLFLGLGDDLEHSRKELFAVFQ